MNKTFCTTIIASTLALNAFSQGQITFLAGPSSSPISYTTDWVNMTRFPVGNPAFLPNFGNLTIAFMTAPNGTPLNVVNGLPDFTPAWSQAAQTISRIIPIPGGVPAQSITLPTGAGVVDFPVELSIVAWTGAATTWDQAINGGATALAWTGSPLSGGALEWSQDTSLNPTVPIPVVTGHSGFAGLVLTPVPDASASIVLMGLSVAGLALFRAATHRKPGSNTISSS